MGATMQFQQHLPRCAHDITGVRMWRLDGGKRSAPTAPPAASKPKMNPPTRAENAAPTAPALNSPELRHDELGQEPHPSYTQAWPTRAMAHRAIVDHIA
jgi:hypothetical protein